MGMLYQKQNLSVYHQHNLLRLLHPVSSEVLLLCSPTINTKLMVIHSNITTQLQNSEKKLGGVLCLSHTKVKLYNFQIFGQNHIVTTGGQ